jgi:hypothetical protein
VADIPAMYQHCTDIYNKMLEHSSRDPDTGHQLYEGVLTQLVTKECGLSMPYYSTGTRFLRQMDCIRQLRRGGGGSPSKWLLIQEPTEELFRLAMTALNSRAQPNEETQALRDLNVRLAAMETRLEIVEATLETAS